jgi:hypothetical protein
MSSGRLGHLRHLAGRFFGSLSRRPPPPEDAAWVASVLTPGEQEVWRLLPVADQRHAVGVARRVEGALAAESKAVPRWALAAALLHDCGKIDSGLGTFGRVGATVWAAVWGRARVMRGDGRAARYLQHPAFGAARLRAAGSDPLTVAWTAEHHKPESAWTVPMAVGTVLKEADDD